ncbi:MAG: hypothetical protein H5T95_08260 [Firmicutes bacterium]|nr:hypothetical protein [Bacillota bacterium]
MPLRWPYHGTYGLEWGFYSSDGKQEVIAASPIKRLKWMAADDEEWNALADQVIEKHIDAWKKLARR